MTRPHGAVKKSRAKLIGFILLGVISGGGIYLWHAAAINQIARRASATTPDLQGLHPELIDRVKTARQQIERGDHSPEALATLLRLYYANGWYEPADQACQGLLELQPRNPQWPYVLGLLRANGGQLSEALPYFQKSIDLAPAYLPVRLKTAAAMAKLNQTAAAVAMYQSVLTAEPANSYALTGLGNIHLAQKQWPLARDNFLKAIASSAHYRPAWQGLVTAYEATGNATAAAEAQAQVDEVSLSPDSPDPWIDSMQEDCYNVYYLRVAAASSPDIKFAQRLLEHAVRLQPKDATARKDLGLLLLRAKSFRDAKQHLLEATALAPANADNWLALITFSHALQDQPGITRAIDNGLLHCPNSPGLWLERGRMLQRTHAFAPALAALRKSAELGPQEAAPHVETAVTLFLMEQTDQALAELNIALTLQPNNAFALVVMTRYAIMTHDQTTAQAYWDRIRRNPSVLPEDRQQLAAVFESVFGGNLR